MRRFPSALRNGAFRLMSSYRTPNSLVPGVSFTQKLIVDVSKGTGFVAPLDVYSTPVREVSFRALR
jgi:hypothetical protein